MIPFQNAIVACSFTEQIFWPVTNFVDHSLLDLNENTYILCIRQTIVLVRIAKANFQRMILGRNTWKLLFPMFINMFWTAYGM